MLKVSEFEAEKAKDVAAELPEIQEPSSLPGWGAWSAQQRDHKWMRDAKAKAEKERQKAAAGRTDAKKQFVVISEKYDRKAMGKYTASEIPFPYDSRETYERSMRQPLGRQYNPDAAFRDLIRPAVLKNTGAIIAPIKYTKPLAKQAAEITSNAHKSKVLTVSGGVMKLPKKAAKQ